MKSRRWAREIALQALYQCDTLREWQQQSIDFFFQHFILQEVGEGGEPDAEGRLFARRLVDGVIEKLELIDGQIRTASEHWSLPRMARVDRNILRIAAFELAYLDDVPVKVTINEAIEIAKKFGTAESATFVNGVLDRIAVLLRPNDRKIA